MPAQKRPAARFIVTVIVSALALAGVWAVFTSSKPPKPPTAATPGTPATPDDQPAPDPTPPLIAGSNGGVTTASDENPGDSPADTTAPQPPAPANAPDSRGYRARVVPAPSALEPIGSINADSGYEALYTFTHLGAGVESITLTRHYHTLRDKISNGQHFEVQKRAGRAGKPGESIACVSLGARAIIIDGQAVDLFGNAERCYWTQASPGVFEAVIEDGSGNPVARIKRSFTLARGSFEVRVSQTLENLAGRDLNVEWIQYGPLDIEEETFGYNLDMRRVRYGYLLEPRRDPSQTFVEGDNQLEGHAAAVSLAEAAYQATGDPSRRNALLFPRPAKFSGAGDLVWIGQTSRYFTFAVHPLLDAGAKAPKRLVIANEVYGVALGDPGPQTRLALELHSVPSKVNTGGSLDLSFASYAGPLYKHALSAKADPSFGVLALGRLVVFNLGGCCSFCTFQWLGEAMLVYLDLVHAAFHDWTLSIIVLVLTVRAVLHPITRKSQINMSRFGKKMAALAPKQKKIQEQYAGDPKQMQLEMARLMREEGVSPAQALGCLPTFLQTPVWIALYAMLYFAFQFRHQPGFYGVFQTLSGGKWSFLADLSAPDHFIEFGSSFHLPLMGAIGGINLLPLVLGVVFYIQQKYLSPPSTGTLTPEQEMQQKMMKVMMVVMFPLMMYNAPSGLAVYFITNSTLGIIESRWVRAHIDELDKNPPPEKPASRDRKKVANEARAGNPFARDRELKRFKDR